VKFSFLGGRLLFKNLTVIDKDQTICALQGSLTWRYWLPVVRRKGTEENDNESLESNNDRKLPCRYFLEIEGLEYFIYNRTVSYDNILKGLSDELSQTSNDDQDQDQKEKLDIFSQTASDNSTTQELLEESIRPSLLSIFFPLQIKVNKGGIVMGNKTTHAVLISSFDTLDGAIDIKNSSNPLDVFRQFHEFDIERLQISLKPNILHEEGLQKATLRPMPMKKASERWILLKKFLKALHFPGKRNGSEHAEVWRGLSQYLESDTISEAEFLQDEELDYAKYTTILVADSCKFYYFFDIPGVVPSDPSPTDEGLDVGNGGSAPVYGLDLQLSNATIYYGPWADRQRHTLHQMILPTICRDAVPQEKLQPGQNRIYTNFVINIEILDDLIVRVPTREFSKDESFKKNLSDLPNSLRPFGWIELKIGKESTITVNSSPVASKSGYESRLDMTLHDLEARSSVNHDIFLKCKEHTFSSDIGYPLSWNGHTTWILVNKSVDVETFLLREHITLLSDLFSDFGSGDPTPYELFRPFTYVFDWKVDGFKLYFNINDANIVNNPLDFNDNIYLSLQGDQMKVNVHIPLESIIRKSTTMDYTIETPGLSLVLDTPPWHTLNNFLKSKEVGRSERFGVSGAYTYYSDLGLDSIDTVIISCVGEYVALECYGFVVKYIMSIKENYFGDFTSFKTLEEYTNSLNKPPSEPQGHSEKELYATHAYKRTENETDVHFSFCFKDSCAVLPSNIYDCDANISLPFESLDIDIRFTNYYMDMQVDSSPIKGFYFPECDPNQLLDLKNFQFTEPPDLSIDFLSLHGLRVFGLPPDEPTCFCKWDIVPGAIAFDGSMKALQGFVSAVVKLGFGYSNLENKLELEEPEIWDMTNLSVIVPKVDLTFKEADLEEEINICLESISFRFSDITNFRFSDKLELDIKAISALVTNVKTSDILLDFKTALRFTDFCLKKDYKDVKRKQDEHIVMHDGPFHRLPFLVENNSKLRYDQLNGSIIPGFSLPNGNPPLTNKTVDALFEEMKIGATYFDNFSLFENEDQSSISSVENMNNDENYRYWKTTAGADVKPTIDYEAEDYTPMHVADPEFETDNVILNFGKIDLDLCLDSLIVLLKFCDKFSHTNLSSLLDNLHVTVLEKLKISHHDSPILDLRFVTSMINLNVIRDAWKPDMVDFTDTDHINVFLEGPSIVMELGHGENMAPDATLAFHMMSLAISVNKGSDNEPALDFAMCDFEAWFMKNAEISSYVNLGSIDSSFHLPTLNWILSFVDTILDYVDEGLYLLDKITSKTKSSEAELVYQIALASSRYNIENDPAVITRPAYIIRLSKEHIRANDSWNVIVRLRHIFNSLPQGWFPEQEMIKSGMPKDVAMNEVLDVFRQWRSWEFADISNCFIFKHVFSQVDSQAEVLNSSFELNIDTILTRIFAGEKTGTFIEVNELQLSSLKEPDEASQDGGISNTLCTRIGSIKGDLSPLLLDLNIMTPPNFKDHKFCQSGEISDSSSNSFNSLLHLLLFVDHIDLSIHLRHTTVKATVDNLSTSFVFEKDLTGTTDYSGHLAVQETQLDAITHKELIFSYGIKGIRAHGTGLGGDMRDITVVDASSEIAFFNVTATNDLMIKFILGLESDVSSIMELMPDRSTADISPIETKHPNHGLGNIKLRISNKTSSWVVAALNPFEISGSGDGLEIGVFIVNDEISLILNVITADLLVQTTEKYPLVTNKSKNFSATAKYNIASNELSLGFDSGDTSIMLSDAPFKYEDFYNHITEVHKNSYLLSQSCKEFCHLFKDEDNSVKVQKAKVVFVVKEFLFNNSLFSLGLDLDDVIYSVDVREVSLKYYNIVFGSSPAQLWPFGEMKVDSTQFNLRSDDMRLGTSSLVDFNFVMKIVNVENSLDQTLEVQSSYSRIMITPLSFVKMISLVKGIRYVSERMDAISFGEVNTIDVPKKTTAEIWQQLGFSSIHILSYGFCLGFIFNDTNDSSPGLILGCNKVFTVTEGALGKFTIIGGYGSLANGNSSDSFFSAGDEVSRPNRAFLPNVQVTYSILRKKKSHDVDINVTGEELDVKFITSSIVFVEQIIQALTVIEHLTKKERVYKMPETPKLPLQPGNYSLPSDLRSIRCTMNFKGAIVKMARWEDFTAEDDPYAPSFVLRTPAVKIITEYAKTTEIKKHYLNFEVFTFYSSNVLYNTCVPVLYDVWKTIKHLGKKKQSFASSQTILETSETKDPAAGADLKNLLKLLKNFQIQFVLHIDKQELTLSCEPTAKVKAVVGIESIDVHLGTSQQIDDYPLSGTISIGQVGASLQHSFSTEISGSIMIKEILLTAMLTGTETFKLYTSASIDKIGSYLYLKQLQDVDMFMDLWKFDSAGYGTSEDSIRSFATTLNRQQQEELILKKFQRVSNSTLLPWDAYFLMKDLDIEVDIGQSLGVLSLNFDKVSIISRKKSERKQDLIIAFDTIMLKSEGRLSGHLTVEDIQILTVINWSIVGDDNDVPMVLLYFGFAAIEIKASFDYNVFMIGKIKKTSIRVFNQVDAEKLLHDRLVAKAECDSIELFITSFAASDVFDVFNTLVRIRQDNKTSYRQNMQDPVTNVEEGDLSRRDNDINDILAKLRVALDVKLGKCLFHVYPGSLLDLQVLIVNIGQLDAYFEQHSNQTNQIESDLKLALSDMNLSLSSFKSQPPEDSINSLTIDEFVKNSSNAQGGGIFIFPSLKCAMTTYIEPKSRVVQYVFHSSFGGKVDIRWNLGSINFIREMWMIHVKSLSTRLPKDSAQTIAAAAAAAEDDDVPFFMNENLDKKIKDVSLGDKYQYIALEIPIIEAPQLKELGEATPPLEWFGLNRQNFPGLTHQVVIVSLQKLVREVETQYARVLGKA
jgi:hypothetical protein